MLRGKEKPAVDGLMQDMVIPGVRKSCPEQQLALGLCPGLVRVD